MRPCTIRAVDPSDFNQVLPDTVPLTRARDNLNVSGASAIPCHGEAGALGRVRNDLVWGRELLAFHTRASLGGDVTLCVMTHSP